MQIGLGKGITPELLDAPRALEPDATKTAEAKALTAPRPADRPASTKSKTGGKAAVAGSVALPSDEVAQAEHPADGAHSGRKASRNAKPKPKPSSDARKAKASGRIPPGRRGESSNPSGLPQTATSSAIVPAVQEEARTPVDAAPPATSRKERSRAAADETSISRGAASEPMNGDGQSGQSAPEKSAKVARTKRGKLSLFPGTAGRSAEPAIIAGLGENLPQDAKNVPGKGTATAPGPRRKPRAADIRSAVAPAKGSTPKD